jgi:hypothetical protein
MTYHEHMEKGINYFHKTTDKALEGYLIYAGDLEYETAHYGIRNFMNIRDLFL